MREHVDGVGDDDYADGEVEAPDQAAGRSVAVVDVAVEQFNREISA